MPRLTQVKISARDRAAWADPETLDARVRRKDVVRPYGNGDAFYNSEPRRKHYTLFRKEVLDFFRVLSSDKVASQLRPFNTSWSRSVPYDVFIPMMEDATLCTQAFRHLSEFHLRIGAKNETRHDQGESPFSLIRLFSVLNRSHTLQTFHLGFAGDRWRDDPGIDIMKVFGILQSFQDSNSPLQYALRHRRSISSLP